MSDLISARPCPEMLDYLSRRRSVPVASLCDPGPDVAQIQAILKAAARVPDHGKLFPWHFLVFEGQAREAVGGALRRAWLAQDPQAAPAKLDLESARFLRAPLVVGVISRLRPAKHPAWEQALSAGAACQNLCLAANALGFGTNWLSEWYAYSPVFRKEIGLDERDRVAGFVYIGTMAKRPEERDRPDISVLTTRWTPGAVVNRGDSYDRSGLPSLSWLDVSSD
ncbi:MAG: nitroreductase [Rhodospirillales bacterium]|nr:nitroreductase [Rhodospirillales bacterium]